MTQATPALLIGRCARRRTHSPPSQRRSALRRAATGFTVVARSPRTTGVSAARPRTLGRGTGRGAGDRPLRAARAGRADARSGRRLRARARHEIALALRRPSRTAQPPPRRGRTPTPCVASRRSRRTASPRFSRASGRRRRARALPPARGRDGGAVPRPDRRPRAPSRRSLSPPITRARSSRCGRPRATRLTPQSVMIVVPVVSRASSARCASAIRSSG
jgi:hypothetical protein